MRITKAGWAALTLGEKLSALSYAAYLSRQRWQRRK
jgi:hypothetical protein